MRKIGAFGGGIVRIVGQAVSGAHPHRRVLQALARRLEIVGVKLLRNNVVIGIERGVLWLRLGRGRVALTKDEQGTNADRDQSDREEDLCSFLEIRGFHFDDPSQVMALFKVLSSNLRY